MVSLQRSLTVTRLVPCETTAISARSVYTIQPCTMSRHFIVKQDPTGSVSSSSTLQIFRKAYHLRGLLCPLVYLLGHFFYPLVVGNKFCVCVEGFLRDCVEEEFSVYGKPIFCLCNRNVLRSILFLSFRFIF